MDVVDRKSAPDALQPVVDQIEPEERTVLRGIMDSSEMDFVAQWIIRNGEAPLGDSRDWDAVQSLAEGIADEPKEPG